jgi:hypothetical protein
MEAELWKSVYHVVKEVERSRVRGGHTFADALIVLVLLWAAFNHRPVSWAVQRRNWPVWCLRWIRKLPSSSTMSRRPKSARVQEFLAATLEAAQERLPRSVVLVLDGKPLVVGGGSKDAQARYGRAVGGKAKGYKLHALVHPGGRIERFRVAPMNIPEQRMAARLLRDVSPGACYVLGDGNYDSNQLHGLARLQGLQLVAPRRKPGTGLGRRPNAPGRARSIELTEGTSAFGTALIQERDLIERYFGNLTSFSAGLGPLPAWVRTHQRVHRWVTAKLIINAVRIDLLRQQHAA